MKEVNNMYLEIYHNETLVNTFDDLKIKRLARKGKKAYPKLIWIYFQILLGLIVIIAIGGIFGIC